MAVVLAESLALIESFRTQISSQNRVAGLIHPTGDLQKRNLKLSFNNLLTKLAVNCGF